VKAVLVTGSRRWNILGPIENLLDAEMPDVVIHGAGPGADDLARRWCDNTRTSQVQMPADWNKYGRVAGPQRNTQMLKVLQALRSCGYDCKVLAFPLPDSRGTKHMLKIANDAGFECREVGLGR